MKFLYTLLLCASAVCLASAQTPTLLKDLNPGDANGSPTRFFPYDGQLLFRADTGPQGVELFITDGTPDGTVLLKDINTDASFSTGNSNPDNFVEYKGKVYFKARAAGTGDELWVTDGTPEGTVLLKDINPGEDNSAPFDFILFNDLLYFTANDGTTSSELWVTDGTADGTKLAVDINPGGGTGIPNFKYVYNGLMYFSANSGASGAELHVSDGTPAGTRLVKDIRVGSGNALPSRFYEHRGRLFFRTNDGELGTELYRTDGTEAGTRLVKDINPGAGSSSPDDFQSVGEMLFFTADDGTAGTEPWQTRGGTNSTTLLADVNSGPGSSKPTAPIEVVDNAVYTFIADTGDGPRAHTLFRFGGALFVQPVNQINDDLGGATDFDGVVNTGANFYFTYDNPARGSELGEQSIASETARPLIELVPGAEGASIDEITVLGERLLFEADNGTTGKELYTIAIGRADVTLVGLNDDSEEEILTTGDTLVIENTTVATDGSLTLTFVNVGNDSAAYYTFLQAPSVPGLTVELDNGSDGNAIPPGRDADLVVTFTPKAAGSYLDSFEVGFSSATGPTLLKLYVAVRAVVPGIVVTQTQSGATLASGGVLDFSGTEIGMDSTQQITITNSGEGTLSLTDSTLSIGRQFRVSGVTEDLEPGESKTLDITFRADAAGEYVDTLKLRSNASGADTSFVLVLRASILVGTADLGIDATAAYPNPVTDVLTVELAEGLVGARWTVSNAAGQTILGGAWPDNSARHQIDLRVLPKGTYQLRVQSGERGMVVQLIR